MIPFGGDFALMDVLKTASAELDRMLSGDLPPGKTSR